MNGNKLPTRRLPWGFAKTAGEASSSGRAGIVKYVDFNLTGRCQAGCISCPTVQPYPDEKKKKTEEDLLKELELFKNYLSKLKKLGLEFATIYGREPLLWDSEAREPNKYLRQLISWLSRDLKVRVCLATSGMVPGESVLETLFAHQGILFMKDWGSRSSVEKLIRNKEAYPRIRRSWELVRKLHRRYKHSKVVAEFLYTGINRKDLFLFWKRCLRNGYLPFVEVPVIKGACVNNYRKLAVPPLEYVRDIYGLSLLNLSLRYGLDKKSGFGSDIWYPPFGSIFPSPCDKLTRGKGLFLERNGDLSICCGVNQRLGNINDPGIAAKLRSSPLLKKMRAAYKNLMGYCSVCDYSVKLGVCYGCRGNGYTYPGAGKDVFSPDPLCFGMLAAVLAKQGKLAGIMSPEHIKRTLTYFKERPLARP